MAPARLGIAVLASVVALLAVSSTALAAPPGVEMAANVNALRANYGRHGLAYSPYLTRSSQAHARRMLKRGSFSHGASTSRRGEVLSIHFGSGLLISNVVRAWEASEGHRNLLLDSSFRTMGAAYARGRFRGRRSTVWVVRIQR